MNIDNDMNVIVIGDAMIDVKYTGCATRIAQEACIPIVNINNEETEYFLGGAANVYNNLTNLGIQTYFISVIGCDAFGKIIRGKMHGISNILLDDTTRCTTVKHRFYVNGKIVFRYDVENANDIDNVIESMIITGVQQLCTDKTIIILSDYNKGVLTERVTREVIGIASKIGALVFVDPKTRDIHKYAGCFMIKPNKTEGEQICSGFITPLNLRERVKQICDITGSQNCLLTIGELGMAFYRSIENDFYIEHTDQINVIDITGAGDVVLSGFTYYYIKTHNIIESIKFANYCGQLKVRNFGTYTVTLYDVLMYEKTLNKIIPNEHIDTTINIIRNAGKRIVLTNGCYDILHYGHLTFLEESKKFGDILIVALNTDNSVKINKGNTRPINKLDYRIKQISAISCVDYIITFNEKTPFELIQQIRPDVLTKGGDYNINDVVGREYVREVKILEYRNGFSTTDIIKKIEI